MSLEKMRAIVRDQLPTIDEIVAKWGVPIVRRPLEAAMLFVNECIVEIEGDKKEDFWEKRWFSDIYQCIEDWYKERYGDALKKKDTHALALVLIYGTPFKLNIPLTIIQPDIPGKTFWVAFPNSVMPDENVLGWVDNAPNLDGLSAKERGELIIDIKNIATTIRSIHVNLMTAQYSASPLRMLGGSIAAHLEKAVEDILSMRAERLSIAFWELHLAVEKSLKLYLRQRGLAAPNTHDLLELRRLGGHELGSPELDSLFSSCLTAREAIRYRYGETENLACDHAVGNYHAALEIVRFCTKALKRKIIMDNARILLKVPPWKNTSA